MRNVNNTPYTLENIVKNTVSCKTASKVTMLSMGSLELLLRASVFTTLDLNEKGGTTLPWEVDVFLKNPAPCPKPPSFHSLK